MRFKKDELVWVIITKKNPVNIAIGRYEAIVIEVSPPDWVQGQQYDYAVQGPDLGHGGVYGVDEHTLRKRNPPAEKSFDDLMSSLTQPKVVWSEGELEKLADELLRGDSDE